MRTAIRGAKVITPLDVFDRADVLIEDSRILAVGPDLPDTDLAETIDAEGQIVAPGYIDVHVHGSAGHDIMDGTREAIEAMARFFATRGVTSFCATTLTAPAEAIMTSVRAVHDCQRNPVEGAQPLGIHLEGPYIEAGKKGAQPEEHVTTASAGDYKDLFSLGNIRLITLAPEIEENKDLIVFARSRGAAVAVGHSDATYEELVEAVELGINHATHTFNRMGSIHHRKPGTVSGVLLLDKIYAQVIADGIHLHPAIVDMIVRLKCPGKALLVTDAMRGAGMPDGEYEFGGRRIVVREDAVRLEDGTLASSALTMDRAVRNVRDFTGRSIAECLQMATLTPARSIAVADRKGSLEPGKDADIVILDPDLNVLTTMVMGKVVYTA